MRIGIVLIMNERQTTITKFALFITAIIKTVDIPEKIFCN